MAHTYDAKAFGPGSRGKGNYHVVHIGSQTAVWAHDNEEQAREDCADRNARASELGTGQYEVRPEKSGKAIA